MALNGTLAQQLRAPIQSGCLIVLLLGLLATARAGVRFDVFLGYDGVLPEAAWFPVVCEVQNDGPTFNALVEVTSSQAQTGQRRVMVVELPTGTTKRFVIPAYSSGRYGFSWNARVLDEKGRVRAEQTNLRVRNQNPARIPLIAAMARTMPTLPDIKSRGQGWQLTVARLQPAVFPDNPIALEGMDVLYLNTEKALDLKVNQVNALTAWVRGGGRLIVGVEQAAHLNGCEWLRRLIPFEVTGLTPAASHPGLQDWLTNRLGGDRLRPFITQQAPYYAQPPSGRPARPTALSDNPYADLKPDTRFESQPLPVAAGTLHDGRVIIGSDSQPLAVSARRGRGEVVVLLFNPELEPFVSWQHRPHFWARLADLPPEILLLSESQPYSGGWGADGLFGAMIDSRQVRKLPIGWLLVLLLAYLGAIGPLDRWWLKKINRQMWTWITFPTYVACFSLLIYFIGYKLRAGETEYNELHVVDIIPAVDQADWRGRTYASLYSPVNARYPLASDLPFATLRGEHAGGYGGGREESRASVEQRANGFQAELSVPVWTSQLFIGDWWRRAEAPLRVSIADQGGDWEVRLENHSEARIASVQLVANRRVFDLGSLAAGKGTNMAVSKWRGDDLASYVQRQASSFMHALQQRQQAFSTGREGFIENLRDASFTASFIGLAQPQQAYNHLIPPAGLDLTPLLERGDAVVLAWVPNWTAAKPMNRFSPKRSQRNTLLRVAVDMSEAPLER